METESSQTDNVKETEETTEYHFEEVFKYKFQDNVKFIEGWRKVKDVIAKEKLYESLIKAQVYFYSREFEPVDLDGYKNWLSENDKEIQEFDVLVSNDQTTKHKEPVNPDGNRNEKSINSVNNTESVKLENSQSSTQEDTIGKHPANFIELIEMIQSGMKLPDTEDLNIEPLNEDPTPCEIQRPKKPWEVS